MLSVGVIMEKEPLYYRSKLYYIYWWEWILLFFRPAKISADFGYDEDKVHGLITKELFGKIYVVKEF